MNPPKTPRPDDDLPRALIELHLGRLDAAARQTLLARIETDPHLQREHEALGELFSALATYDVPAPPADLHSRICARIEATRTTQRILAQQQQVARSAGRLMSLRDLMAVAAVLVMMIGIGVPGLLQMRQRARRVACSWNLGQIGRGLQAYAATFAEALPFAGWDAQATWSPTRQQQMHLIPNRRHLYPLLRRQYVPSAAVFICPGAGGVPMPAALIPRRNDFLESRNISYAGQNMAGVRPTLHSAPDMPIVGDDNPIFADGIPLLDVWARRFGLRDPSRLNSRAHGGSGQNILTLGGVVRWVTTPDAGLGGDNIWTLQGVRRYTGREGPRQATDTHLLK